jgi:hypothetical protein
MIALEENDKNLLELATLQVPWYMVCGEFHRKYGSAHALAWRLMELREAGLIEVRGNNAAGTPVSAEDLEADALANDCYEDLENTREPEWQIVATDLGVELIEERLARE